ncbi:MAG: cation transporter, partial [candidate division NC10 bacterium]|nr:cation transporter [candidate division NC10 bacterium]
MARDPICGMDVLPEEAAGTSRYRGVDYYFCAVGCKEAFDKSPEQYVSEKAGARGARREVQGPTPAKAGVQGVNTKVIEIPIRGMSCASCVQHIEQALQDVPGVVSASVNFATERATVAYLDSVTGPTDLRRAIEAAGYAVPDMA